MDGDTSIRLVASVLLIIANAFFVAAEYALISSKKNRLTSQAKKGSRTAKLVLEATDHLPKYIAGIQIAITMVGIGVGSITEPLLSGLLKGLIGPVVGPALSIAIAVVLVTFLVVILGELIPKYVSLAFAERIAQAIIIPLNLFVKVLTPLVWLVQTSGGALLRLVRIDTSIASDQRLSKTDLRLLLQSESSGVDLEQTHADVLSKALRFDELDSADIMIHRLDMRWLDVNATKEQLFEQIYKSGHTRLPVCRGDIDDILGILYVQDLFGVPPEEDIHLEALIRPAEVVPENLTLSRIVERMREARTQILIVVDEYGGTSGLITLEDVIEEVFGELDDHHEAERPTIQEKGARLFSVRADTRYDELLTHLGLHRDEETLDTRTLAQIVVDGLERMPKLGDTVECPIGTIRVENMARRRITRVRVQMASLISGSKDS